MKNEMLAVVSSKRGQKSLKVAGAATSVLTLALGPATALVSDTPIMPF